MFVLIFNAAHYFQFEKKKFSIFFSNYARKFYTPFMEILFPHENFLHGNILPLNHLPPNHPKSPWKRLYTS